MADIMTPALGESVTEATVARWSKGAGEAVKKDETLVELETDKVSLEVVAPADGTLQIEAQEGATVTPGTRLGVVSEAGATPRASPAGKAKGAAIKGTATSAAPDGEGAPDSAGAPPPQQDLEPSRQPAAQADAPAPLPDLSPPDARGGADGGGSAQAGGVEVTVPTMGESVSEGAMGAWSKKVGDRVSRDEILVEIETDKVAVEVNSPADGVLSEILAQEGATVIPNQVIARVSASAGQGATPERPGQQQPSGAGQSTPANQPPAAQMGDQPQAGLGPARPAAMPLSPSVQRIATENRLDTSGVSGSGKDGRITKGDALAAVEAQRSAPRPPEPTPPEPRPPGPAPAQPRPPGPPPSPLRVAAPPAADREERVRMSRLRQTIARRLKEAQDTAAMLTTFNEVDMTAVMALRNEYKEAFEKRHGVKLGFMSFFVRACIAALKEVPAVNAEIDGTDLIYKNHYDIGVAVGTEKGLVVPVVRDADTMSLAEIEKAIGALGKKARDGQLSIEDMQGGTFTISNGGVYGSLMSTPILNAPQSGILGMHKIQERPMVVGGKIEARPMMYLALSYDHRVVDGKEAVTFLVSVKDHVEDPQRLVLDL